MSQYPYEAVSSKLQKMLKEQSRLVNQQTRLARNIEVYTKLSINSPAYLDAVKRLHAQNDFVTQHIKMVTGHSQLLKSQALLNINRDIASLGRAVSLSNNTTFESLAETTKVLRQMESLFRLPKLTELEEFSHLITGIKHFKINHYHSIGFEEIAKVAQALQTPWVYKQDYDLSLRSVAQLAEIGKALSQTYPFNPQLVHGLRDLLGDWRRESKVESEEMLNPVSRSELYADKGLDKELTEFPPSAFSEIVQVTGIQSPLIIKASSVIEVVGNLDFPLEANAEAYRIICALEAKIRQLIINLMTQHFGESWIKRKIPGDMLQKWQAKKEKALENNAPDYHLIEYADFTDYKAIIICKSNWEAVFKPVFKNKDSISESLQRLFPVRLCTMHSRAITEEDRLFLYAEAHRILKAISLYES